MAENLIAQKDYSHENVLHTASYYLFGHNTKFKLSEHGTKGRVEVLRANEESLYRKFGVSTYSEFINIIQQLFVGDRAIDRKILASFSPEILDQEFESVRSGYLTKAIGKEVTVVFENKEADKKLQKALKTLNQKNINVRQTGDLLYFTIGFVDGQAGIIKQLLNELFSEQLHYSNETLTRALREALSKRIRSGQLNIISDGTQPTLEQVQMEFLIDNYPWGYTLNEIRAAISKPGSEEEKAFLNAMNEIYEFIINKCNGGTPELIQAAQLVYDKKIGKNPLNFRFFTGAGGGKSSMLKAIKGSLGEFQAALMFEYFNKRLGYNNSIATIVGNLPARGSEQGKADLSIYEYLGVQVKNWNEFMQHNIETNIHPIDFANTLSSGKNDFLQFIANIYFNTTYYHGRQGEVDNMMEELRNRVRELQNLDLVSGLKDKVSFYLIQGRYLVPASDLLELMSKGTDDGLLPKDSIWLTPTLPGKGKSDLAYREMTANNQNKWWKKDADGNWTPEGTDNEKEFNNLISKSISIRTKMDLSGKLEKYNLLKV